MTISDQYDAIERWFQFAPNEVSMKSESFVKWFEAKGMSAQVLRKRLNELAKRDWVVKTYRKGIAFYRWYDKGWITMAQINFNASNEDLEFIIAISERAMSFFPSSNHITDVQMDLTACHLNGCPLDLPGLYVARDFDFAHDINGIARNLDRKTGKLRNSFLPRYRKK